MHRVGSLVALALGIGILVASIQLSIGSLTQPGPGLWPGAVACVLIIAALITLITDTGEHYEPITRSVGVVGVALALLVVFVASFLYVGFILPGLLLFGVWLRVIGKETWRLTVVLSVGATAVIYLVFVVLLGVPFPEDVVAEIWGGA